MILELNIEIQRKVLDPWNNIIMENWKFMNFVNLRKLYILLTSLIIVIKVERNNKFWWNKLLKPYFKKLCWAETLHTWKNDKDLTKCDVCWPLEQISWNKLWQIYKKSSVSREKGLKIPEKAKNSVFLQISLIGVLMI